LSHYWIQPLLLIGNLSSVGATSRSRPVNQRYECLEITNRLPSVFSASSAPSAIQTKSRQNPPTYHAQLCVTCNMLIFLNQDFQDFQDDKLVF